MGHRDYGLEMMLMAKNEAEVDRTRLVLIITDLSARGPEESNWTLRSESGPE